MTVKQKCRECGVTFTSKSKQEACPKCILKVGLLEGSGLDFATTLESELVTTISQDRRTDSPLQESLNFSISDRYDIENRINEGAIGNLYYVKDKVCRRFVAMKKITNQSNSPKKEIHFIKEAQITGQLEHPNIVPLYDLGLHEDDYFYTMKFIQGVSLHSILKLLKEGNEQVVKNYSLQYLLTIFQSICDAIRFAHSRNVVHLNLNPRNVIVGNYGEVIVIDWGLANLLKEEGESSAKGLELAYPMSNNEDISQDLSNDPLAKDIDYLSPEQVSGNSSSIDKRSDVYSLGAMLYTMLTLHKPFSAKKHSELRQKIISHQIPDPKVYNIPRSMFSTKAESTLSLPHIPSGEIPKTLSAIAIKAMAKQSRSRYASVRALQDDIEAFQDGFSTSIESVNLVTQLLLLIKRRKSESATLLSALFITLLLVLFGLYTFYDLSQKSLLEKEKSEQLKKQQLADQKREWKLHYTQNFDSKDIPSFFSIREGYWKLENRALAVFSMNHRGIMLFDRYIGRDFKVELDSWCPEKHMGEFGFTVSHGRWTAQYEFVMGKSFGSYNLITQGVPIDTFPGKHLVPDQIQKFVFIKRGDRFTLQVDGKTVFEHRKQSYDLKEPKVGFLIGPGDKRYFDNFKIYSLSQPRKLDRQQVAKELVSNGEYHLAFIILKNQLSEMDSPRTFARTLLDLITNLELSQRTREFKGELHALIEKSLKKWPKELALLRGALDSDYITVKCHLLLQLLNFNFSPNINSWHMNLLFANLKRKNIDAHALLKDHLKGAPNILLMEIQNPLKSDYKYLQHFHPKLLRVFDRNFKSASYVKLEKLQHLSLANTKFDDLAHFKDAKLLSTCDFSNTKISDLQALENLPLVEVNIDNTRVSDIRALKGDRLSVLKMNHTLVADLSPLENTKLLHLEVNHSRVKDLSPLKNMPLRILKAKHCKIKDFSVLTGKPINHLELDGTDVEDLSFLNGMNGLRYFSLNQTPIKRFPRLRGSSIDTLYLSSTKISSIKSLNSLPLRNLAIDQTMVKDISPLTGHQSLLYLDISDTQILDLFPLSTIKNLSALSMRSAKSDDFYILEDLELNYLDLRNSQIKDLSLLSNMKSLAWLFIGDTSITDLKPIANLPIIYLEMKNTKVKDLSPLMNMPLANLFIDLEKYPYQIQLLKSIKSLAAVNGINAYQALKRK